MATFHVTLDIGDLHSSQDKEFSNIPECLRWLADLIDLQRRELDTEREPNGVHIVLVG